MKHWFVDLPAFRRDPLSFVVQRGNGSSEPLTRMRLGPKPVFLVTSPELIKPLLSWSEEEIDKGRFIKKLRPAFGDSSLWMSGEEHRRRRAVLHARLARGTVLQFVPQMSAAIRKLAAGLTREGSFDAHPVMGPLTLRLICIALFGHEVLSSSDETAMVQAVHLLEREIAEDMFRALPRGPRSYLRRRHNYALAHETMSFIVERVRANAPADSVISTLLRMGLSDEQIRDEVLTMLLAGHHTTAGAAAWLLYHLICEPGLADAVAEEARIISDCSGEIRPEKLKDASISLALVREVLRLYPSAWWFSREIKRPVEVAGRKLKPGTSLIFCPWQLHRDPRHWSRPESFSLDRSYTSGAYLPFGAGPRACVGMGLAMLELQLLALELSSAFELSCALPAAQAVPVASVTLVPPRMTIDIKPRTKPVPVMAVA